MGRMVMMIIKLLPISTISRRNVKKKTGVAVLLNLTAEVLGRDWHLR
jgi:hypothetical protein